MRPDRPQDLRFGRVVLVFACIAGPALGALASGWAGAVAGAVAGLLAGAVAARRLGRRSARRRAALAAPFPGSARETLLRSYDHYERLDPEARSRIEDDVRLFLLEKRITGVKVEVTDELRLLVAASAATLSLGWPEYEWDQLTEVLLYPDDFDRDYRIGGDERAGETHPWGTVILSVPALLESFEHPDDAFHVGLHEFAHLLDVEHSDFGGIPAGLDGGRAREWARVAEQEMDRLQRGRRSAFDDYGAHEPAEFFAVAVEAFFEIPQVVRRHHTEVYRILSAYFRQDPAALDDARGLRE
jgi:Mlc titration factor MtfA (ptsG expression regulator)